MKLRSTLLAALTAVAGIGAIGAGPASAGQPSVQMFDTTFSGPAGVVWSGQCPVQVSETDNASLPELCRPHGSDVTYLLDKGITSYRYATAAGQTVAEATVSATAFNSTSYIQPGTTVGNVIIDPNRPFGAACPVVGGAFVVEQCVKSGRPVTQAELDLQRSIALANAEAKSSTRATAAKKKATKKSAKVRKAAKHHR